MSASCAFPPKETGRPRPQRRWPGPARASRGHVRPRSGDRNPPRQRGRRRPAGPAYRIDRSGADASPGVVGADGRARAGGCRGHPRPDRGAGRLPGTRRVHRAAHRHRHSGRLGARHRRPGHRHLHAGGAGGNDRRTRASYACARCQARRGGGGGLPPWGRSAPPPRARGHGAAAGDARRARPGRRTDPAARRRAGALDGGDPAGRPGGASRATRVVDTARRAGRRTGQGTVAGGPAGRPLQAGPGLRPPPRRRLGPRGRHSDERWRWLRGGHNAVLYGKRSMVKEITRVEVATMTAADIPTVLEIERRSFPTPWPRDAYTHELDHNRTAVYLVARREEAIVGFAGMWVVMDEGHITTIAVDPPARGQGIGERLLIALIDRASERGARWIQLEVRRSNVAAQNLYRKYGFRDVGVRRHYYSDNGEDALVMWTGSMLEEEFQQRYRALRTAFLGS